MDKREEDDGLRKKGTYKLFQAYWHDKPPPFEFHYLRDRWRKVYDKAAEMFGADNARLQSENAALREALKEQKSWHEAQAKALSKQPPNNANEWMRLQHREQIDAINAALAAGSKTP